jgi:pilus assembly protein CpaB
MRSRGLVVVLALILATLATVGVFLYSQGVKEDARSGGDLVTVVVSKVDIPANTDLNALIRDGRFTTRDFPREALVNDPVRQLSQLQGRRNSVTIFAGEQIPVGRIQSAVTGGALAIPEGHQAMTVDLSPDRAISGLLAGGDNVVIYATFADVEIRPLTPQAQNIEPRPAFDTTVVLAPEVEVLSVVRPSLTDVTGETTEDITSSLQIILAFEPDEAQKFVFALEMGTVYLSLLRPNEDGTQLKAIGVGELILPNRAGGPQG